MLVSLPEFVAQVGAGTLGAVSDQAFLDAAIAAVESYCRRSFAQATHADYLDGTGTWELVLPPSWLPLTAVTEVRLDRSGGRGQVADTFGTDTVLTQGQEYVTNLDKGILEKWGYGSASGGFGFLWEQRVGPTNYWRGLSTGGAVRPFWPRIPGCVKVTATAGYADGSAPADLKNAVVQYAQWLRLNPKWGGLFASSQSYIDVSAGLSQLVAEAVGNLNLPAMGSIRQVLSNYREVPIAGGVR